MKIIQINDNDLFGRAFNGYDIAEHFNNTKEHDVKQLVLYKYSKNNNVEALFRYATNLDTEYDINLLQQNEFSVQGMISATSYCVAQNKFYQESDLAHYHQIHNMHLNLDMLCQMAQSKPTVISLHDPWFLTGRCVHPAKCTKWQTGCQNCENLNTLFQFDVDNCGSMWKNKKSLFEKADLDIIVYSKFMLDLAKQNPYIKNQNIHLVDFGIDFSRFKSNITKESARKKLKIPKDSIVLFFRSQKDLKGTEYIVEALKELECNKKIVLLTCSGIGLLEEISNKYQIIELGNVKQDKLALCYNACDIFLMPSLGESFGMMAVEAMACGRPVIVFDNTALPHVTFAPDCGLLAKDRDSDDLREKILFLIDHPEERERRGLLGKELALKHYNLENHFEQMNEVYKKAYERQKYKLSCQTEFPCDFVPGDDAVQNVLSRLEKYADSKLPVYWNFKCFENVEPFVKKTNIIDYNNENVRKAFIAFSIELSKWLQFEEERLYNISISGFRKLKIYQLITKIPLLKKLFNQLKKVLKKNDKRYNDLLIELRVLEKQTLKLEKAINTLHERMENPNE